MSTKFRSYDVARKYFSLIEFLGWVVIALSVLAFIIIFANSTGYGAEFGIIAAFAMLIGGGVMGLFCVAAAQFWRTGVDTAEYTQQMLQLSRDHLEISRQGLNSTEKASSFASTANKETDHKDHTHASFSASPKQNNPSGNLIEGHEAVKVPLEYMGYQIQKLAPKEFKVEDRSFPRLSAAQEYVDLVLLPKKLAKKKI